MEQETRGCVSRVTRVPGGKYPTPAIPGPLRNAIPRAQYGMQYQAQGSTAAPGHGSRHSGQRDSVSGRLVSDAAVTHPRTV
jgi:hypothetical protein